MSKWVRHISGQGERWEIDRSADVTPGEWCVMSKSDGVRSGIHWLPKSEYVECEGPEEWEDVTGDCDYCGSLAFAHRNASRIGDVVVTDDKGYRFRKVRLYGCEPQWAFVVERRKS